MVEYLAQSLFEQALGPDWKKLHESVRRHYDVSAGGEISLSGRMSEVYHSPWVKPFIAVGRLFGALVPYVGQDVPVEVRNFCRSGNNHLHFNRRFFFAGRKPYAFDSCMEALGGNEIVEFVRFGLGIRMKVRSRDDGALVFSTNGYLWRIGRFELTLPDWLFFGSGDIVERGSQDGVDLDFTLVHPLFGKSFRYAGHFGFTDQT